MGEEGAERRGTEIDAEIDVAIFTLFVSGDALVVVYQLLLC